ncbi:MAG: helix-turn-helix domain-containing protein [Polyangiaceae bacterium]|nr:helix-turn-helix domain-containing protein [Polyangiaceae bacterium]
MTLATGAELSLREAAAALGKSLRQVRYLITTGRLAARKTGGEWRIRASDLQATPPRRRRAARKLEAIRTTVDETLAVDRTAARRPWSVRDMKAFQIGLPLQRTAEADRGLT